MLRKVNMISPLLRGRGHTPHLENPWWGSPQDVPFTYFCLGRVQSIVTTQMCLFESFPKLALDNCLRQSGSGPKCLGPTYFKSPLWSTFVSLLMFEMFYPEGLWSADSLLVRFPSLCLIGEVNGIN